MYLINRNQTIYTSIWTSFRFFEVLQSCGKFKHSKNIYEFWKIQYVENYTS